MFSTQKMLYIKFKKLDIKDREVNLDLGRFN
jgi:hypothetical protein